jgi:hypothetical protein
MLLDQQLAAKDAKDFARIAKKNKPVLGFQFLVLR